ncbi:MAG: FAD-dependent oxidoreductase, partial [Pseudomonadales bacterium]
ATANVDESLKGREHAITSNEAFHLDELPKKVIVAGGGYISVEFAGIFNGLGIETTLLYRGEEILRGFDDDLRVTLHEEMEKKSIRVITGSVFTEIEKSGDGYKAHLSNGEVLDTGLVMFAIGRDPNTKGLGLETVGIKTGRKGEIIVDQYAQTRTSKSTVLS